MSADDTKQNPDVESTAPEAPEPAAAEAAVAPEVAAVEAQPEAAAEAPAEATEAEVQAEPAEAEAAPPAAEEKPARKPAAKAAPKKAEKPAAKPKAARAAKAASKKPAAKEAASSAKAERPPKPHHVRETHEPRHGSAGVATVIAADGKQVEERQLKPELFAVPADVNTLHLVVRAEQAARRRGTASTKTRGEVSGSTAKLYRQKGTGRARAGSVKSPVRTGGGIVFGPHPRTYDIKVNRKVVRKALAMALSNRAENGNVFVAGGLDMAEPSTRTLNDFLVNLDIGAPVLVVTCDEPAVAKSVRNLRYAECAEVGALSTEQVLRARSLVLTEKAYAALNEA